MKPADATNFGHGERFYCCPLAMLTGLSGRPVEHVKGCGGATVAERIDAVRRRADAIVNDRAARKEHDRLRAAVTSMERTRAVVQRASCGCDAEHPTLEEWERVHGAIDMSRPFRGGRHG